MRHNWFSKVDFVAYTYKTVKGDYKKQQLNIAG